MILTVLERIVLLNVLPEQGDFRTLRIVRELREELSFSEAENVAVKFQPQPDGTVKWDGDADPNKDVPIGEIGSQLIVDRLKELDKQEKLTLDHLSTWDKFIH